MCGHSSRRRSTGKVRQKTKREDVHRNVREKARSLSSLIGDCDRLGDKHDQCLTYFGGAESPRAILEANSGSIIHI